MRGSVILGSTEGPIPENEVLEVAVVGDEAILTIYFHSESTDGRVLSVGRSIAVDKIALMDAIIAATNQESIHSHRSCCEDCGEPF